MRRMHAALVVVGLIVTAGFLSACLEQYNPRPYKKQFEAERQAANRPHMRLTEDGKIPASGAAEQFDVAEIYNMYCATCHGTAGKGDGPGSAIDPKPRDFTDVAWQKSVADDRIEKVIRDGGAAVGLSPLMAPWGAVLNEPKLKAMVEYVRQFGK